MQSFWDKLPRPFFAMAPLADVTDPAWRALVAKHSPRSSSGEAGGAPYVTYTEFVSADGLWHLNGAGAGISSPQGAQGRNGPHPFRRPLQPFAMNTPVSANPLMRDLQFTEGEHPIVAQFFTSK